MPSKSRNRSFGEALSRFFLVLFPLFPIGAWAAPNVIPYSPNRIVSAQGIDSVFYASTNTPSEFSLAPNFPNFSFQNPASTPYLNFTIDGISDDKPYLYVFAEIANSDGVLNVPLGLCNDGGCTVASGSLPNQFDTRNLIQPLKLSLDLRTLCVDVTMKGCTLQSGQLLVEDSLSTNIGIQLYFVASEHANPNALGAKTVKDTGKALRIVPQVRGPTLKKCPDPPFFPGDGSILVENRSFLAEATISSPTTFPTSPAMERLHVIGHSPGPIPKVSGQYARNQAHVKDDFDLNRNGIEVTGFENSLDALSAKYYEVDYGVQDSSGLITWCGLTYPGNPGSGIPADPTHAGYPIPNAFATDIRGFLNESNCFIATASYRDGRASGVMLLREFRDTVLSRSAWGRAFIDAYYSYGPKAANWLLQRPLLRGIALTALIPVQALAWITLHPSALWVPLIALFIFFIWAGLRFRSKDGGLSKRIALSLIAGFMISAPESRANESSKQPYIDSLLSEVPAESYSRPSDGSTPYIDSVRKKMKPSEARTESYIEEIRQEIPEKENAKGYSRRLQETLPKKQGSAIEDFRKGKQLQANKGDLNTRSAVGLKLLAGATRTYSSTASGNGQVSTYDTVYGNKWIPDFTVHYEYRPFSGDFLRKLGLYGSLGASFTKASGKLAFQGGLATNESKTEFRFIVLPVNLGLIYRFNIANFVFPYVAGGPSAIGFIENRSDSRKGNRGYALGYWFSGGVAFGLDWISSKNSWDQYQATGTKHTYLTLDYTYLESLGGGLVEFTVDGVQIGITFEI